MVNPQRHSRAMFILALALPIGLFAGYIAYLIVPEILRVVVPSVVQSVLTQ